MWLQGTGEIIRTLNDFYISYYKEAFNQYYAELEFTTILTYYSGSCALVIDIHSTPEAKTSTDMCIMLECSQQEMRELSTEVLHNLFTNRIISKYIGLLELNKVLCSKSIQRKVIIKTSNFNENVLNISLEKELIQIELNDNKITESCQNDSDLVNTIEALSSHILTIKNRA